MKSFTKISIALAMTVGMTTAAVAGDAKAPEAKAPAKKEEPKKMEMPKPAPELVELGKTMSGNWKCTGKGLMDPSKPNDWMDMKMTMKMSNDMGGMWIKGAMDGGAMFKGEMYVTFDPVMKKFVMMMRDSMGASEMRTSTGMKDNKMVWEGDARMPMPGMSAMKVRETNDMTDMKAGLKLTGEYSMDGKTFMKMWEATCKK